MVKWTGINLSVILVMENLFRPAMSYTDFPCCTKVSYMDYHADHVRLIRIGPSEEQNIVSNINGTFAKP